MMGSGKSTIGALLADRLGWPFFDTDLLLEAAFGGTVPDIFAGPGEPAFRRAEGVLVPLLAGARPAVIATGGGLWASPEARSRLLAFASAAWLDVPVDVLWERLRAHGLEHRPLLAGPDPRETLDRLLADREPLYGLAEWRIPCGDASAESIVDQILGRLRKVGIVGAGPGGS
ncbi:MAG TPA: shikimate kinase [Gemmatimonadota bacterium]|jgi:shikimate kinase